MRVGILNARRRARLRRKRAAARIAALEKQVQSARIVELEKEVLRLKKPKDKGEKND